MKEKDLLAGLDLDNIVKGALSQASEKVLKLPIKDRSELEEAYVALPKPFRQGTEFSSQDTKDAHDELYKGYIEQLNAVSAELDVADLSSASGRLKFAALKRSEVRLSNAVNMHELFFSNCFDPNSELFQDMLSYMEFQRDWGDFNRWQMDFQNVGLTGSGNGWVVCGYSIFHKRYLNIFVGDHDHTVLMGFIPVLAVDMWEHSYFRDFLADRKSYLVAMMREINWNIVEQRVQKASVLAKVMK